MFTDVWVYVFLFLHNALVLEAQPCDFDWIGTQLFQANKQKKEEVTFCVAAFENNSSNAKCYV